MSVIDDKAQAVDGNLVLDRSGAVRCVHCDTTVGSGPEAVHSEAILREGPPSLAGPQVRDSGTSFVDRQVVFRQVCCPGCYTALLTEVVPADEPSYRGKSLRAG